MKKYQQGDVVMYQVDDVTFNNRVRYDDQYKVYYAGKTKTKAILAFGEVTGHTHRVDMSEMLKDAGVTLHMDYNRKAGVDVPNAFEVHNESVEVQHEEHDTVTLPPGNYVVKIVREFNHITRRAQYVAD